MEEVRQNLIRIGILSFCISCSVFYWSATTDCPNRTNQLMLATNALAWILFTLWIMSCIIELHRNKQGFVSMFVAIFLCGFIFVSWIYNFGVGFPHADSRVCFISYFFLYVFALIEGTLFFVFCMYFLFGMTKE